MRILQAKRLKIGSPVRIKNQDYDLCGEVVDSTDSHVLFKWEDGGKDLIEFEDENAKLSLKQIKVHKRNRH